MLKSCTFRNELMAREQSARGLRHTSGATPPPQHKPAWCLHPWGPRNKTFLRQAKWPGECYCALNPKPHRVFARAGGTGGKCVTGESPTTEQGELATKNKTTHNLCQTATEGYICITIHTHRFATLTHKLAYAYRLVYLCSPAR